MDRTLPLVTRIRDSAISHSRTKLVTAKSSMIRSHNLTTLSTIGDLMLTLTYRGRPCTIPSDDYLILSDNGTVVYAYSLADISIGSVTYGEQ